MAELLLHHLLDLRLPLLARGAELAVHVVDLLLVHGLDLVDLLARGGLNTGALPTHDIFALELACQATKFVMRARCSMRTIPGTSELRANNPDRATQPGSSGSGFATHTLSGSRITRSTLDLTVLTPTGKSSCLARELQPSTGKISCRRSAPWRWSWRFSGMQLGQVFQY